MLKVIVLLPFTYGKLNKILLKGKWLEITNKRKDITFTSTYYQIQLNENDQNSSQKLSQLFDIFTNFWTLSVISSLMPLYLFAMYLPYI